MLTDDPKKDIEKTTTPGTPAADSLKSDAVKGKASHDGDLAPPPRNRRSTDPKTPPTQALADTKQVESTTGLRALLQSFLSKIMPTKPD